MAGKLSIHVKAAIAVFKELGVDSLSTHALFKAARERNLVPEGVWIYHHMTRQVRACELFDTSTRGKVVFLGEDAAESDGGADHLGTVAPVTAKSFPGPVLGEAPPAEAKETDESPHEASA